MVFIGIVVAVVVLLSFLLITSGAIGAIGGAISSAWTGLCSGVGWLTGAGAASTGGGSIIGSVAGKALLDTGKEAFVSTTKTIMDKSKEKATELATSPEGQALAVVGAIEAAKATKKAASALNKKMGEFTNSDTGVEDIDNLASGIWLGAYRPFYFVTNKRSDPEDINSKMVLTYVWVKSNKKVHDTLEKVYTEEQVEKAKQLNDGKTPTSSWIQEDINEIDVFPCHTILWTPKLDGDVENSDMGVTKLISTLRGLAKDYIENRNLNSLDDDEPNTKFRPKAKQLVDKLLENKELNEFQHYLIKQEINQQLENTAGYVWGDEEKDNKGQIPPKWQDIIRNQKKLYDKTVEKYFGAMDSTKPDGYHKVFKAKQ